VAGRVITAQHQLEAGRVITSWSPHFVSVRSQQFPSSEPFIQTSHQIRIVFPISDYL